MSSTDKGRESCFFTMLTSPSCMQLEGDHPRLHTSCRMAKWLVDADLAHFAFVCKTFDSPYTQICANHRLISIHVHEALVWIQYFM